MAENQKPFWKAKTLEEMTKEEWESLCDSCAKCCLYRLQDEDTGEIFQTNVACKLLDLDACRCTDYRNRHKRMPSCVLLTPARVRRLKWLPDTCAYRLLAEGKDLPEWHPLVSGTHETVRQADIAVTDRAIPEDMADMDRLEDYIAYPTD